MSQENSKIDEAIAYLKSLKDDVKSIDVHHIESLLNDFKQKVNSNSGAFNNSILDEIKYGVYSVSTDFVQLFYVNPAILKLTEYSKEDFISNPKILHEIVHPEDLQVFKNAQKEFFEQGSYTLDLRIITKTNKIKWIHSKEILIKNNLGQAIRIDGMFRDVSKKKKIIENELKNDDDLLLHQEVLFKLSCLSSDFTFENKQQILLREAAKVLNAEWLGIWMFNHSKSILKSKYRYCLSQDVFLEEKILYDTDYPKYFEKLKGLTNSKSIVINDVSKEEFTAKLMLEHLVNIGISSMLLIPIYNDSKLLGAISISNVKEIRNWSSVEQSFASSLANIFSIYFESEEKRIIGKALIEKTKVLLEAQHVAKIGNYIIDLNTGEWKSSVVFDQVFGIDRTNYKKDIRNWVKLISPEYSEHVFIVFKEVLRQRTLNEKSRFDETFKIIRQNDGEVRWVSVLGEFQYDEGGNPTHMLGTMQDITKRKLIELELIQSKELAEGLLQTKANFLSNMSHEIRTPLNGIIGFTHLLQDSKLDEDQLEMVQAIEYSGKNLLVIINDILDFSKMEAQKMLFESIPFDLIAILKNTLHLMVLKSQEKGVELIYSIDEKLSTKLIGDPTRLNQILNNLVGNAVKFTEKGFVELNVSLIEDNEEHCLIEFSVVDSGIGIEEEKQELIFESFSQASNNTTRIFGGTGLGLAITKKLIEQQNGTLEVYSEVGEGSTFKFCLWFKKQENQLTSEEVFEVNSLDSKFLIGKNILVAEDIDINRKLIKRIFEKWGCKIDLAEDGQKALEMSLLKSYDLILMDLQMPIMGGLESASEILKKYPTLPIVALSAYTSQEDEGKCINAGMRTLITKPIDQDKLLLVLYKYLIEETVEIHENNEEEILKIAFSDKLINFNYLNSVTNGDDVFKKEMVDLVATQLPKFIFKIREFMIENKPLELKREIHKLKSTIGILGLDNGKALINEMETEIAQTESLSTIKHKIHFLIEMCEQLQKEIEELDIL